MTNLIIYPFDSSGVSPGNQIQNEQHNIVKTGSTDAFLFVPNAAPFFGNSLSIVASNGITLIPNVDYYLTHYWAQASNAIGSPIYGSITMLNRNPNGVYRLNYNTIGGDYVVNKTNAIIDASLATANEYLSVDWSTAPTSFPPTPHSLNTNAIKEYPLVCESIMNLANAVRNTELDVDVDDIHGLVAFWSATTMIPFLELITSVHNSTEGVAIALVDTLSSIASNTNKPVGLNHYEFSIGNIIVKLGSTPFLPANVPSRCLFVGNPFPNKCLLHHVWVTPYETTDIPNDTIKVGAPQSGYIPISLTLDSGFTSKRTLSYIMLGM